MTTRVRARARALGLGLALLLVAAPAARAEEALIAVAANFTAAARDIGAAFEAEGGHSVTFSFGSTGKLYAQIAHGAPFHAFLAADVARPEKAEAEGLAVSGSRFTYALGRLALYSPDPDRIGTDGAVALAADDVDRLAIANPVTAPYGAAALEVLAALDLTDALRARLVQGDTIMQTHQFVVTGNVPLGFVALAQIVGHTDGSRWLVPQDLYTPLRQDAVLLRAGADSVAARAFLDFLRGPVARDIITGYGYGLDDDGRG
ncbi:molybdate ABC transporter substrate-binding protein [Roseospira goensis]|uniref:Molybdate transport system substrate-binding protein n=1 Tax=Roseospira goensis TaxID=391922 RepID=A0A7W6S2P6_9PROT|nr:molybdate ABC transporter substrate-binding protein [Roseospira goensis]MBB4287636.1 molybdate transport system substrate-binding protein [Roseospira goensis]